MEDSNPRPNRPDRPPSSAHVIDLRQSATAAPLKAPPSAAPKPQLVKPRPAPAAPLVAARPEPARRPEPAPVKAPAGQKHQAKSDYVDAPFAGKPRFWPAFWRFLLLLIVLGVIVVVGVYVYLNYYQAA